MKRIYNIIMAATAVAAIFFYLPSDGAQTKREVRREVKKYRRFLKLLSENHLDTLNYHDLTERAIYGALELCDPHSQYLPKDGSKQLRTQIESAPIETSYMVDSTETLCIKVSLFSRNTSDMILYKYQEAGSPSSLVLDLRGNKGGLVEEAILTAELFLSDGDLILTRKGRTVPTRSYYAKGDGVLRDLELYVVIDRQSASASEIVVGALKDNDRAEIVGERSFGKGLILKQHNLCDSSSVLIAFANYLTPDSKRIQSEYSGKQVNSQSGGITPTIKYECGKTIDTEDVMYMRKNKSKSN